MTEMMNVEEARRRIPPEILEKLGDRYGSFQYLSSGATSSVFKADDKVLAKSVALKVLLLSETRELLRFQKEAQAASKLNHPNLLTAMDFNITHDNKAYIVMDFVEGESVEARVQREGALSLAEAVDISKQIARGMENAHQQRVVHRDLKTSNIMLSERDSKLHVTVIDFGLARLDQTSLLENCTVINGLIQGSPLYMSPEQAFGNPGDHRSDIYSLACIIFKMLSERTPFESSETVQLLQMHAQAEPPLLSSLARCTIPVELDRLVARMLVKDPDRRPQSMKEVFDLLSDLSDVPEAVALAAPARLSNWRWMVPLAVLSFIIVCSFSYKLLFADKVSAPVPIEKRPPPSFALLANERLTDEVTGYLAARTPDKLKDEDFRSLAQWEYGEGRDLSTLYSDDSSDDLETGKHRLGKKSRPNALSLHNVTGITGSGLAYIRDNNFVCLDLSGTRLNDDGYKTLGTLTSVNRLIFDDARTTDKQLQYIVSLPKLHTLSLARCAGITDNGLVSVGKLNKLVNLNLGHTKVSDRGMRFLKGLHELKAIDLTATRVTDAGVQQLKNTSLNSIQLGMCKGITTTTLTFLVKNFPGLKQIAISAEAIPSADLHLLGKFKKLEFLTILAAPVDKRTLEAISGLKHLAEVHISNDTFADADLEYFLDLKDLRVLSFRSDKITAAGQKRLHDRLPKCQIYTQEALDMALPGFNDFYGSP